MDLESSPDHGTPTEVVETAAPETGAAESGNTEGQGGKSLLDIVSETAARGSDAAPGVRDTEANAGPTAEAKAAEVEQPLSDEVTNEELNRYGTRAQTRIRSLLEKNKAAQAELEPAKEKAGHFDGLMSHVKSLRLDSNDLNVGFEIMGLMKNDPAKAVERLTPIFQQLLQLTGNILPDDLQREVSQGYISQQRAQELARARAGTTLSQAQLQSTQEERRREAEAAQQREQAQATERHVGAVAQAITGWEDTQKRTDPDWQLKAARVSEGIELAVRRDGYPKSPQEVIQLADKVLTKVTSDLRAFGPAKRQINPVTGGRASTNAQAAPKSIFDIVSSMAG